MPNHLENEPALVDDARAGNAEAFTTLVKQYDRNIYRLALKITGNKPDAEDILQESFLKAFEHLTEFREDSRYYTWLVRIAVNEGLMKLRKRRSYRLVHDEDQTDEEGNPMPREFVDWKPNPEQLYAQAEQEEILQKAIDSISPKVRCVFLLRDVEKLSTEETAQVLGLSTGAVRSRLLRGRIQLREKLSKTFRSSSA